MYTNSAQHLHQEYIISLLKNNPVLVTGLFKDLASVISYTIQDKSISPYPAFNFSAGKSKLSPPHTDPPSKTLTGTGEWWSTELTPHPDQKYVDALLTNNTRLLNELYAKFLPLINRMVVKNNGTLSDAADLFQEAMIAIYRKAQTGALVLTSKFDCFIYKVCKNQWLTALKRKDLFIDIDVDTLQPSTGSPVDNTEEAGLQMQRLELFLEKFAELGDRCKELILLSWSGRSMREVAGILNMSFGFCRKKKAKIIARLIKAVRQSPTFATLQR